MESPPSRILQQVDRPSWKHLSKAAGEAASGEGKQSYRPRPPCPPRAKDSLLIGSGRLIRINQGPSHLFFSPTSYRRLSEGIPSPPAEDPSAARRLLGSVVQAPIRACSKSQEPPFQRPDRLEPCKSRTLLQLGAVPVWFCDEPSPKNFIKAEEGPGPITPFPPSNAPPPPQQDEVMGL